MLEESFRMFELFSFLRSLRVLTRLPHSLTIIQEKMDRLTDSIAVLTKVMKFKKLDGKTATCGAQKNV